MLEALGKNMDSERKGRRRIVCHSKLFHHPQTTLRNFCCAVCSLVLVLSDVISICKVCLEQQQHQQNKKDEEPHPGERRRKRK